MVSSTVLRESSWWDSGKFELLVDPLTHPLDSGVTLVPAELCMRGSGGSQLGGDGWDGMGQEQALVG